MSLRTPQISPKRRQPPAPFRPATGGSVEQRISDLADAINRKADTRGVPNFTAINLTGEDGKPYLIYVDAAGTLRCVPVTL